jgi:type I restriction-modification system DNA methylase subunit
MNDMFSLPNSPYDTIYQSLRKVREAFYRDGRIADSNAKLDETVKLLAIHFAFAKCLVTRNDFVDLFDRARFSVVRLNEVFLRVATSAPFANSKISSIFGTRPCLTFETGDESVAFELFTVTGHAFDAHSNGTASLDVLNEAFGHYVRDNFRNHIEDAQYMTPPEVVDFMVSVASTDLLGSRETRSDRFVMADPSCGVGTFLTAWRKEYDRVAQKNRKLPMLLAVGQDKVERMVRLSAANLIFADNRSDRVFIGNSLADGSHLDDFNNSVDLILTNPPFGAKFTTSEVKSHGRRATPIFARYPSTRAGTIDSELLFIDRYLSLLRPGGLCLAIVPDGVISAKGLAAFLRRQLLRRATLRGVVELPPVTFAQAGTRTKTAVLIFRKRAQKHQSTGKIFFGEAHNLGFEVSKRKGVPIKRHEGANQLPAILETYKRRNTGETATDRTHRPFIAQWRQLDPAACSAWTPRQFAVDAGEVRDSRTNERFRLKRLFELVEPTLKRKTVPYDNRKIFVSVLHVIGEGILDVARVKAYTPVTPGLPINPGEVIISRLNPRIPRVLVVPDLGCPMLCSSEFEVLRPRKSVPAYALAYLLLHPIVQEQIHSLTAGTSASHSRIRPERLHQIQIPWPTGESRVAFDQLIEAYEASMRDLLKTLLHIHEVHEQRGRDVPVNNNAA